jgi:hypothetical protein
MISKVQFSDFDGTRIRVQGSSLATEPAMRVYMDFVKEFSEALQKDDGSRTECLHLTRPQAEILRAAIDEWLAGVREEWG